MSSTHTVARRTLIFGSAAAAVGLASASPASAILRPRRAPFATWDPVAERSSSLLLPSRVTIHFAGTTNPDRFGPDKGPRGTYPHFYNPLSGKPRQHQDLTRQAASDHQGNRSAISVSHAGVRGEPMTESQLDNIAEIFAWSVSHCYVPNRIATVDNLKGLAWHRLGVAGDFGAYDPDDRKTWSRAQTRADWSTFCSKDCPTDGFIDQLDEIFERAQPLIRSYCKAA